MRQLVLGVYPSAVHVRWTRPGWLGTPGEGESGVAAMAVDVEPCVFWSGDDDTSCAAAPNGVAALVERWARAVGFRPGDAEGEHGRLAASTLNGPSGQILDTYFRGLPIGRDETAFADVYPVFFVHRNGKAGKGRKQGDAMDVAYNSVATRLTGATGAAFAPSNLPTRPSARRLPKLAQERFGEWLTDLILGTKPEVIVTLGQEPWDTLECLGAELRHPAQRVSELHGVGQGAVGSGQLRTQRFDWLPMPHPGSLMRRERTMPA